MIICSRCNAQNFDDSLFCYNCGGKIEIPATQQCLACGNIYKAASKFCNKCGAPSGSGSNVVVNNEPDLQSLVTPTPIAEPKTYVKLVNVQTGATYEAELGEQLTIGKRDCGITIPDDKTISGTHCQIYTYENNYVLADMQSTNGTKLNDYKIETPVFIEDGSILGIGKQKFTVTFETK